MVQTCAPIQLSLSSVSFAGSDTIESENVTVYWYVPLRVVCPYVQTVSDRIRRVATMAHKLKPIS